MKIFSSLTRKPYPLFSAASFCKCKTYYLYFSVCVCAPTRTVNAATRSVERWAGRSFFTITRVIMLLSISLEQISSFAGLILNQNGIKPWVKYYLLNFTKSLNISSPHFFPSACTSIPPSDRLPSTIGAKPSVSASVLTSSSALS